MNGLISVDASKARNEFFKLLNDVYVNGKGFLVRKAGIPVAEIRKYDSTRKDSIMRFAGAWKDMDTNALIDYIYSGRKDKGELKRSLLNFNEISS